MNIKDVDFSDYTIKSVSDYKSFKENIKEVFPKIEQNYDDSKRLLVNFILMMEEVYKENPHINKIGFITDQSSSCEDSLHNLYIHGLDFDVINADTKEILKGTSAINLSRYVIDVFEDKAYEKTSSESGNEAISVLENDLCFEDFSETSKDKRFDLYREMIKFGYIHNQEALEGFVESLENGQPIEKVYQTVNLLGKDIELNTMEVKGNRFKTEAYSNSVNKLRTDIEKIESAYVMNLIKEVIIRENLDVENKFKIKFEMKNKNDFSNYFKNYTCIIEDSNKKSAQIDIDFAFKKSKYFSPLWLEVDSKDNLFNKLTTILTGYSKEELKELEQKANKSEDVINNNYTDLSEYINYKKPRMKM